MNILADVSLGQFGSDQGLGPFGGLGSSANGEGGLRAITGLVSSVIGFMTIAAGIWFLFHILIAGINWTSAGGDKAKLQTARDKLTNAFLGLFIVVASWAILALIGTLLGVDFTIKDPSALINLLNPSGGSSGGGSSQFRF